MDSENYRVLLIEDDKLDQIAFERLVKEQKLPYECTIAPSVARARQVLASNRFDVILADYMLPDGTAFDILDAAKPAPFVFVTGAGDEAVAVKAWKAGACDYLIKDRQRNYLKTIQITIDNAIRHKKTEAELRLLSAALTGAEDSMYITDMDDKIIFVNRAFCKTCGCEENEILGKNSTALCEESPIGAEVRQICPDADVKEVGFYHTRKNGTRFPVSLSRTAIRDEKGRKIAMLGTVREISESPLAEDRIRNLNLKLKEEPI